jgi:hypothetical protein
VSNTEAPARPEVIVQEKQATLVLNVSGCIMQPDHLRKYLDVLFESLTPNFSGKVEFIVNSGMIEKVRKEKVFAFKPPRE